ncbi:hypothetical protein [Listeria cornellensis]|uniref:Lipoprotein n=1 Tax=Listeria cornellensis FSL F6-0969 TaxID=1265820 RepID=W7BS35_9LIST|nr:hypothetical protein [Listeria cornellensis]EUJ29569.1 hypothetical protein PCORN_10407 [Listeria cornellensis FSL F6-0969]
MKKGIGILLLGLVLLLAACGNNEKNAETPNDKMIIQLDEKNVTADANDIFTVTGKTTPSATVSIGDVSVDADKKGKFELMHVYEGDKSYEVVASKKGMTEARATVQVTQPTAVKDEKKEQEEAAKEKAQKEVTENAKPNAAKISFAMLSGNPDKYARESYYLKGQVAEVIDGGATKYLKVNMTQAGSTWKDTVMVIHTGTTDAKKGDILEIYGTIYGTYAFDDANGATIAMPGITASSINVVK